MKHFCFPHKQPGAKENTTALSAADQKQSLNEVQGDLGWGNGGGDTIYTLLPLWQCCLITCHRILIWRRTKLGYELAVNETENIRLPAPLLAVCHTQPLPFFLARHFGRPHSPFPPTPPWSKVDEPWLLVTLPNLANRSRCESSCDRQQLKRQHQIKQLEGTQQSTAALSYPLHESILTILSIPLCLTGCRARFPEQPIPASPH